MIKPLRFLKNFPIELNKIRFSINKERYSSVNLYFQDEARFGLMTHLGKFLTASGVRPIDLIITFIKPPICMEATLQSMEIVLSGRLMA